MRFHVFGLIAVLILVVRSTEAKIPGSGSNSSCLDFVQKTYQILGALSEKAFEHFGETFPFIPRADGGDGSGGDGSGGDGTGGDGSGGDGTGDSGDGNGDGPSGDTGAVGNQGDPGSQGDPGDQGNQGDPSNDNNADPSPINAPTVPANTVVDAANNDPALGLRGPGSPGTDAIVNGTELGEGLPADSTPPVGVNVGINAVIVSGAPTPWEAIGKGPGVNSVTVMGGIIALGQTALAKPPTGILIGAADNASAWLIFRPDMRYLNGSVFPPVVPNVIDIRIISNTEQAIENPSN